VTGVKARNIEVGAHADMDAAFQVLRWSCRLRVGSRHFNRVPNRPPHPNKPDLFELRCSSKSATKRPEALHARPPRLLIRFLLVILMIVKEASDLSLERRCRLQVTDGTGAVEELPLELRGNGIPAHKHGRAQALQNLPFFLGEDRAVFAFLSRLNRLIDMERHPFFVFRQRRVGLLEVAKLTRFVRRTRCVGEECPEFGCFGSVLLCTEHLTRPFSGEREHNRSPLPAS
jgi:hypothetical protein